MDVWQHVRPLEVEALRASYRAAEPTHFFCVDGFLEEGFCREVMAAYPTYGEAQEHGHEFSKLNEHGKVQITNPERFPEPVRRLHECLCAPELLEALVAITGIEDLQADHELSGGGMHVMGSGGRLDVHVDFNLIKKRSLYRRLNILVFFNERWEDGWGGTFELWDPDVKRCLHALGPLANRCVVFNTTETSYHGVRPIRSPEGVNRNSYAAYYYTAEPPAGTTGEFHTTLFRARPEEWWRGKVLKPTGELLRSMRRKLRR